MIYDRKCRRGSQRRRQSTWANPEASVGTKCEKQIGNLNCYETIGRACEEFLKVAPRIKALLDANKLDLEKGERKPRSIAFAIFMVGTKPSTSQPTIVFSSRSKPQRKRAKALVKKEGILADYPNIKMETLPELPALPRGDPHTFKSSRSVHTSDTCEDFSEKGTDGESTQWAEKNVLTCDGGGIRGYGSLLILKELMRAIARQELLQSRQSEDAGRDANRGRSGRFLQIGNETYSLSALHPYIDLDVEEDEHDDNSVQGYEFDSDSEEELEESEDNNMQGPTEYPSNGPKMATLVRPLNSASEEIFQTELDYHIVQVHGVGQDYRNIIKVGGTSPRLIIPRVVASKAEERNVIVDTQTTGPVEGRLMRAPRYIKMPGWSTFQEMWVVKMSRDAVPGDCGAWVVEDGHSSNGKFFGQVVAGQPGSFEAYIIPAYQIFDDIEERFGVRPTFPDSHESQLEKYPGSSSFESVVNSKCETYLPANYFNYICGTSTGGLIALMLGKFRMRVDDAIEEYEILANQVLRKPRIFSMRGPIPWFRSKYSAADLEEAIKGVIKRRQQPDPDGRKILEDRRFLSSNDLCRTIVCASKEDLATKVRAPYLFRSYSRSASVRSRLYAKSTELQDPSEFEETDFHNERISASASSSSSFETCSWKQSLSTAPTTPNISDMYVWQVARATTAAPSYFEPVIVRPHDKFVDGGCGFNNPTRLVYDELETMSSRPACFISIGTGRSSKYLPSKGLLAKFNTFLDASKKLSDESEQVHHKMQNLASTANFSYYRFNVDNSLRNIKLDEWKPSRPNRLGTLDTIRQQTQDYLQQDDVREHLMQAAKELVQRRQKHLQRDLIDFRERQKEEEPRWERLCGNLETREQG
ncbi:Acyl transferase/acyl hydrolase/lysophospholipase [Hyaloscypha variabilis]